MEETGALPKCRQEVETELTRTRSEGSSKHMRIFMDMSGPRHCIKSMPEETSIKFIYKNNLIIPIFKDLTEQNIKTI